MPNFNDDISVLSEDIQPSSFRYRRSSLPTKKSSSQSVGSPPSISSIRRLSSMKKKFSMRASKQGPDDVSVSDSLCSGVLRDAAIMDIGGSIGSSAGTNRSAPQSSSRSFRHSPSDPLPGGVADFNTQLNRNASAREFNRKPSTESATSNMTTSEHSLVPTVEEDTASSFRLPELVDDHSDNRREQRKERVKEKLERYKVDQKQLKKNPASPWKSSWPIPPKSCATSTVAPPSESIPSRANCAKLAWEWSTSPRRAPGR